MRGYVYIVSNPSIPGLLKIGYTMDAPEQRVRQLGTTGVPLPFVLEACFLIAEPERLERALHAELAAYRPTKNREFFQLSLAQVLEVAMPLVIEAAGRPGKQAGERITKKGHGLLKNEVLILQIVFSSGSFGAYEYRLEEHSGLNHLDLSVCLAELLLKKLIVRNRAKDYGDRWRSTPRGAKLIADNDLIEGWMREGLW